MVHDEGAGHGLGDSWDTPILGNYHLMMIDVTDQGTVYDHSDPKVYSDGGVMGSPGQKGVIFGVRRLDVRPPFLIGAAAPRSFMEYPVKSPETTFFILDTRDGSRRDLANEIALNEAAAQLSGEPLRLKLVDQIYGQYRYSKIDLIPLTCFAIPPLILFIIFGSALLRLRRTASSYEDVFTP